MKEQRFELNGRVHKVRSMKIGADVWLHVDGRTYVVAPEAKKKSASAGGVESATDSVESPMPGKILKINAKVGDLVEANQVLIVMEAMKMEYSLTSAIKGKVKIVKAKEGEQVELNQVLIEVEKI